MTCSGPRDLTSIGLLVLLVLAGLGRQPSVLADQVCGDPGEALPVLVVHGFNSSAVAMAGLRQTLEEAPVDLHVETFDYRDHNTEWVDHPEIGPRLRRHVLCLADASLEAGGPGRVALVGHSMGGLAIRHAMSADSEFGEQLVDEVALVATLGTPHSGSLLAGPSIDSKLRIFRSAVETAVDGASLITAGSVPRFSNPAGRALAVGSSQLGVLADFPDSVPVFASAGDFVGHQRFLFYSSTLHFGDVVVTSDSATAKSHHHDGLGGTDVVECHTDLPLELGLASTAAAIELARRTNPYFLDCYHGRLPNSHLHTSDIMTQMIVASTRPARQVPDRAQATSVVEVVPLDRDGNLSDDWVLVDGHSAGPVDCQFDTPSHASVGVDIASCSPTAAGADVCWVLPGREELACGGVPWERQLYANVASGPVGPVGRHDQPSPWGIELIDGTRCRLRHGGSWGGRADGLNGSFWCENGEVILGAIDTSGPTWIALRGPISADNRAFPPPEEVPVVTAWFAASP